MNHLMWVLGTQFCPLEQSVGCCFFCLIGGGGQECTYACGSQRTTCRSWVHGTCGSLGGIQVLRLGGKHCYLLRHLDNACFGDRFSISRFDLNPQAPVLAFLVLGTGPRHLRTHCSASHRPDGVQMTPAHCMLLGLGPFLLFWVSLVMTKVVRAASLCSAGD